MSDLNLLLFGIVVFGLMLIGMVLTVAEFRSISNNETTGPDAKPDGHGSSNGSQNRD